MNKILEKAQQIKLVATDIDGVWTDSKMYYTNTGVFMKSFSTYDGMGANLLLKNNFIIAMITSESENTDIIFSRAKKLNITQVYVNEHQKLKRLKYLMKKHELKQENIAYIGDDLNDLDALKYAGFSAAPKNAPILDYFKPDLITEKKGGEGAFRDLANVIFKAHDITLKY
tara:strand:- start:342 stop:854 length:513 start_codon:yes stop_codon:yes gene_type:complete